MTSRIPDSLRELARGQAGVITSKQAAEAGLTRPALDWQLRTARWQQPWRGVYALFSGQPGREAVLWAAVLRAGPGAMLSHQTAAELARISDKPGAALHVTVPSARRVRPIAGVVVHRSIYVAQSRHPSLLPPRTRVEDTVLDLVGVSATFDDACGWLTRALGRGLTTEARMRAAMAARGRMRWRGELGQVLADAAGGVHSVLEFRYHRDVERAHCLPPAVRQARVVRGRRTQYRDALYPRYRVVAELDGRLAHPGDARWRDIRRDNAAAADGLVTLRYGWADVTANPCRTAGELARVLVRRGWAGLPKLCSAGCPVVSGWA